MEQKAVCYTELQVCPRPLLELRQHYRLAIRQRQGCAVPQESSDKDGIGVFGTATLMFVPFEFAQGRVITI